ncbi:ZIP Zinc transporter [Colletotrichum higginsianum IMI 349063]|uniref:ZIP Zinc transporter n=2 Tax=Colletotrichum higginsianum TaxID=80884 RepID=A0A1B7YB49_COLHI|nr:ZIP Zinc transporter [Colletotrichum higginsianum IMI 349063]OBR09292.1 ZIP Zinc transporter [Colletotrichum higginsianum IMI 349063]TIC96129.1 Zinc-regulated transporter 2 [Colletotrichum higginsianum]
MAEVKEPKPQCGGGNKAGDEYDVGLHVAGLFLVLAFSIFGAGFPVMAKKVKWLKVPPKVFFACKHFGTGVLIATAFVHLLPTAFGNLMNPCLPDLFTDDYPPLPGAIMMASMFMLFTIEMWINAKIGGHSHGGPTGDVMHSHAHGPAPGAPPRPPRSGRDSFDAEADSIDFEKRVAQRAYDDEKSRFPAYGPQPANTLSDSDMPPWFVVFYEQYVRQRMEMMNMIRTTQEKQTSSQVAVTEVKQEEDPFYDAEGQQVDPAVYRKMSLNITMLEGGILFHSVFVGMTISITIDGFIILLVAILFHQMFEGLGLGSRIAAVPYPKGSIRPWVLVVAFGTTAPIGQAIGLLTRSSYDPESAFGLIIVGVFNAISSGLLLYAALVDLLAEDFLSEEANRLLSSKDKITAFCYVLAGAAGMSVVGIFA